MKMYDGAGLNQLFDFIGERAVFFSKLIKSTKMVPEYNALRDEFFKQHKNYISQFVTDRINIFNRLAGKRSIMPHNILAIIGALQATQEFKPIAAVIRNPVSNMKEFVEFLLTHDFKDVDAEKIIALGIPIELLNKLIKELKKIKDPEEREELFRILLTKIASNNPGMYDGQDEPAGTEFNIHR